MGKSCRGDEGLSRGKKSETYCLPWGHASVRWMGLLQATPRWLRRWNHWTPLGASYKPELRTELVKKLQGTHRYPPPFYWSVQPVNPISFELWAEDKRFTPRKSWTWNTLDPSPKQISSGQSATQKTGNKVKIYVLSTEAPWSPFPSGVWSYLL